jgi:hypothetical protein
MQYVLAQCVRNILNYTMSCLCAFAETTPGMVFKSVGTLKVLLQVLDED